MDSMMYVKVDSVKVKKLGGDLRMDEECNVIINLPAQRIETNIIQEVLEDAGFTLQEVDMVLASVYDVIRMSALKKIIK